MINIVYTNSNCKDVFNIFKAQHELLCNLPLFVISDQDGDHTYENKDPYYKHWLDAIEKIDEDYFIYNQEDFILYDTVRVDVLERLKKFLIDNPRYSFVRLIKSGRNLPEVPVEDKIYPVGFNSYPLYSMQATIWNKQKFIALYEDTKQEKWFESETYEESCKRLNIEGVYYYDGESRRGGHYDSSVYPYIATAVVKGKWNLSEYYNELYPLLVKNNINITKRGVF